MSLRKWKNFVRNEKSPAADNFHPGFSPESSLMFFCNWQVFWLALLNLPIRDANSGLNNLRSMIE
jgi:hypothetical protein